MHDTFSSDGIERTVFVHPLIFFMMDSLSKGRYNAFCLLLKEGVFLVSFKIILVCAGVLAGGIILSFLRRLVAGLFFLALAALALYLFFTGNLGKLVEMIQTEGFLKTFFWLLGIFHKSAA